jgi:hypothetical protein
LILRRSDMREYLSRGKRKDNGEWVYGEYISWIGEHDTELTHFICPDHHGHFDGMSLTPGYAVKPETVGWYTGLEASDSNRYTPEGKKDLRVFEGDIVQFTYWWFDGHENDSILTGEIVYLPGVMSFGLRGVKNAGWIRHIGGEEGSSDTVPFAVLTFDGADFGIIGNIRDTPELLEKAP